MRECKQAFTLFFLFSRVFFGRARTLLYLLCKFDGVKSSNLLSRPTRGAWIEMAAVASVFIAGFSRAPHGARGLKSPATTGTTSSSRSRPTRGAWIEMSACARCAARRASRAPHGARGLKSLSASLCKLCYRRAPHGARGLKSFAASVSVTRAVSRPTRGAWIEISPTCSIPRPATSRPTRGAWIEIAEDAWLVLGTVGRAPHGARGLK